MILKHYILTLKLALISFLLWPGAANADLKPGILQACTEYQSGADKSLLNACKLYIDGFIDATLLTSTATLQTENQAEPVIKQQSEYMKRAIKMRFMEASGISNVPKTYQICIPEKTERSVIASKMAKSIDMSLLKQKPLKHLLFSSLIKAYPCQS